MKLHFRGKVISMIKADYRYVLDMLTTTRSMAKELDDELLHHLISMAWQHAADMHKANAGSLQVINRKPGRPIGT